MRPRRKVVTWRSMAPIVLVVGVLTVGVSAWYIMSRPATLEAAALREMLGGNTIEGRWGTDNIVYRQYFAPDGAALYAEDGAIVKRGVWQVQDDGYTCAAWAQDDERCYQAMLKDDVLYWIDAENNLGYPFEVLPGEQLGTDTNSDSLSLNAPQGEGRIAFEARSGLGQHAGF